MQELIKKLARLKQFSEIQDTATEVIKYGDLLWF